MADPLPPPAPAAAAPAPAPAPTPTPVAAAVPTAPAAPSGDAARPAAAPVAPSPTAAPAAATPTEAAKPAAEGTPTAPKTSLLAEAAPAPTDSPVPAPAAPVATEAPADAPLPKYDAFTLPEGVAFDQGRVSEFDALMGRYEQTHGVSHEAASALRQDLANFYVAEMQRAAELSHTVWNNTREGWRNEVKDNPQYGKTRLEQTMKDAAVIRDRFATPEFLQMIEYTGAGDHPGMISFVNNIAKFLDKHGLLREGRPIPATKAPAQPQSKSQRRYGGSPTMNGA